MAVKIERKIHKIDASGRALGRLATEIAVLLRGKHKVSFQPHMDAGDIVEVSNVDKLKFTGNKLEQKKYYHYSGYPGGLKEIKLTELMEKSPGKVLKDTVFHMLPDNRLRKEMIKRLRIL